MLSSAYLEEVKASHKDFIKTVQLAFEQGENINNIVYRLSNHVEQLVLTIWQQIFSEKTEKYALITLGSLARRELLPYSDLDLLIIHSETLSETEQNQLSYFIQVLWDQGFKIGHQVSAIHDIVNLASTDVGMISSLMDMRYLAGNKMLQTELTYCVNPTQIWPSRSFFLAKLSEQKSRYQKFDSTAYNLEPNVKNGPGGLRDLHHILWLCQRHFGKRDLTSCLSSGLISEKEFTTLSDCQLFLWKVRFGLHLVAGNAEDRLIFSYQKPLANLLGYQAETVQQQIEIFMQIYFQHIKLVRELNELLIQLFREVIFFNNFKRVYHVDNDFQVVNGFLEVNHRQAFLYKPELLLKIFHTLHSNASIKGIKATTMRLIHSQNYLINSEFRNNPQHCELFNQLLLLTPHVYEILKRMHRFGLLSRYIPEFSHITGQMQYDLFHVYTVDQHSLFVVKNIIDFSSDNSHFEFYSSLFKQIDEPQLLIISALFHDIGKGRGGDHSIIGEKMVEKFCQRHNLSDSQTQLCCFLVREHLLLSHTAQRKDIDDPDVIQNFCSAVKSETNLKYLYLLTVADICATNPKLWNSWKAALLKNLFLKVSAQIINFSDVEEDTLIEQNRTETLLHLKDLKKENISKLWQNFKPHYFLQFPANIIAKQTESILNHQALPLITFQPHHLGSGVHFFFHMPETKQRFMIITSLFNNYNLSIVEARISLTKNNSTMDNYIILNQSPNKTIANKTLERLRQSLLNHLTLPVTIPKKVQRKTPRIQQQIELKPIVKFDLDQKRNRTTMLLVTIDRPGLLANLSEIFYKKKIEIHNAKISTSGEHVEDSFFITLNDAPLDEEKQLDLKQQIIEYLSEKS